MDGQENTSWWRIAEGSDGRSAPLPHRVVYERMKISLEWLSDFVTWTEKDPQVIADRVTLGTAEVEEVEMQGRFLEKCCVGKVVTAEKHPNADRLTICTVDTDDGMKTVVCGGTNVVPGMLVAFAHVGATVKWHGEETVTLEPVKIRGTQSEGMICAAEELGLEGIYQALPEDGERPIMDLGRLSKSYKLEAKKPLKEALALTDVILHINNTAITTRPDLFSHSGFAREVVALGLATWKKKKSSKEMSFPRTPSSLHMHIDVPDLVPRFLGCRIDIESLGETPEWMKKRLSAIGIRSINLPVDITNYVANEIGVPMHSFDADDIKGDVHLRLSKMGEKITTLDGVERELPAGALILNDDDGIFDLLGIMGGLRSSTKPETKHLFIHALSINSKTIRKTVVATGHRTDASVVYEKGVPPVTTEAGFLRAVELILDLIPGATLASECISKGDNGTMPTIPLPIDRVTALIGKDIPEGDIIRILEDLECAIEKGPKKGTLTVTPPLHRVRDLQGQHDLIEEVGRIYGYDRIENVMPMADLRIPERDERMHTLRDVLKNDQYLETVPLSFLSRQQMQKAGFNPADAVEIENPLGDDTGLLQTSTLPALLIHAEKNLLTAGTLRTFHWSHVFEKGKPEHLELSLLTSTRDATTLLTDPFLETKETLLHALSAAGYDVTIAPAKTIPAYAHPGRIADVTFGKEVIGQIFEVHPTIRQTFDIPGRASGAIINLSALLKHEPKKILARALALYPSVTYDVTITRTHDNHIEKLLEKARKASDLLENAVVHDLYQKAGADTYNVTLRFTYRSEEKTLTEEEAKAAHEKVLKAIG